MGLFPPSLGQAVLTFSQRCHEIVAKEDEPFVRVPRRAMISEMSLIILPIEENEPLEDRTEIEHEEQERRMGEQRPHGGHVGA